VTSRELGQQIITLMPLEITEETLTMILLLLKEKEQREQYLSWMKQNPLATREDYLGQAIIITQYGNSN